MDANELDQILDSRLDAAFPSEAERRRYALLQAAATIMTAPNAQMQQAPFATIAMYAEELLSEIEKREVKP